MELEGLRHLVEDGTKANPALKGRLERAAMLVALRPIARVGEREWQVGSEDGLKVYQVKEGQCECTDWLRHGEGFFCKHRLAIGMFTRLSNGNGHVKEKLGPCTRCQKATGLYDGLCGRRGLILDNEARTAWAR